MKYEVKSNTTHLLHEVNPPATGLLICRWGCWWWPDRSWWSIISFLSPVGFGQVVYNNIISAAARFLKRAREALSKWGCKVEPQSGPWGSRGIFRVSADSRFRFQKVMLAYCVIPIWNQVVDMPWLCQVDLSLTDSLTNSLTVTVSVTVRQTLSQSLISLSVQWLVSVTDSESE